MNQSISDDEQKYLKLSELKMITNDEYRIIPKKINQLVTYRKIPLVIDIAYKTFFLNPKNMDVVTKFVGVLLKQDYEYLEDHLYPINNELPKEFIYDKVSVTDAVFKIVDDEGNIIQYIILEMNSTATSEGLEKNFEYQCRLVRVNAKSGKGTNLVTTTLYNFNNFSYEGIDRTILKFKSTECSDENGKKIILNDLLENYEISLPLILKKCYDNFEELTEKERWIAFFATDDIELAKRLAKGEKLMEKALESIQEMNQDPEFILKYNTALDELEGSRDEGRNEGRAEGRNERNIEIAKKMLADNMDENLIIKYSGLTKNELDNLKEEI